MLLDRTPGKRGERRDETAVVVSSGRRGSNTIVSVAVLITKIEVEFGTLMVIWYLSSLIILSFILTATLC